MKSELKKEYSNGEITVVWKPQKCIHAAECVKALPNVYRPDEKPWIKIDQASTEELKAQIAKCPSGALSYYGKEEGTEEVPSAETKVEVLENGPLLVYGKLAVSDKDGHTETKNKTTAFCRCGHSANKPYCDGSHIQAKFEG